MVQELNPLDWPNSLPNTTAQEPLPTDDGDRLREAKRLPRGHSAYKGGTSSQSVWPKVYVLSPGWHGPPHDKETNGLRSPFPVSGTDISPFIPGRLWKRPVPLPGKLPLPFPAEWERDGHEGTWRWMGVESEPATQLRAAGNKNGKGCQVEWPWAIWWVTPLSEFYFPPSVSWQPKTGWSLRSHPAHQIFTMAQGYGGGARQHPSKWVGSPPILSSSLTPSFCTHPQKAPGNTGELEGKPVPCPPTSPRLFIYTSNDKEDTMLSEISQTRKRTNSVGFHLHAAPEIVRVLETENRVGGSETWGVAGAGRWLSLERGGQEVS